MKYCYNVLLARGGGEGYLTEQCFTSSEFKKREISRQMHYSQNQFQYEIEKPENIKETGH